MTKRELRKGFTLIELIIVIAIIALLATLVAKSGLFKRDSGGGSVDVGVSYEPPVVPIRITVSRQGVAVSIEGRVQTPIGTFSAYTAGTLPIFPRRRTLTVVLRKRVFVYELDNRKFSVELPNDLKGRSKLEYDGKGNIVVIIPNPVVRRRSSE